MAVGEVEWSNPLDGLAIGVTIYIIIYPVAVPVPPTNLAINTAQHERMLAPSMFQVLY